jgi:hypothetical protein
MKSAAVIRGGLPVREAHQGRSRSGYKLIKMAVHHITITTDGEMNLLSFSTAPIE